MEKKRGKLTLSGISKRSIENIELSRRQNKNSVLIKKKSNKFSNKPFSNKSSHNKL